MSAYESVFVENVATRLLRPQKSQNLSPLSFLSPTPWLPIMLSYPSLSPPTLTFKSHC